MRWRLRLPSFDRRHERGQVAVLMAVAMVALLGMAGLAVDVGQIMVHRRELVRVADAAALGAASALTGSASDSDTLRQRRATDRAHEYALLHNFDPDGA